jgi:hypothetical protein
MAELKKEVDQYEAMREMRRRSANGVNYVHSVDDSGAYGDSGGW